MITSSRTSHTPEQYELDRNRLLSDVFAETPTASPRGQDAQVQVQVQVQEETAQEVELRLVQQHAALRDRARAIALAGVNSANQSEQD